MIEIKYYCDYCKNHIPSSQKEIHNIKINKAQFHFL